MTVVDRLSPAAQQALERARQANERDGQGLGLHSGHLLIGLVEADGDFRDDPAAAALRRAGLDDWEARQVLEVDHELVGPVRNPGVLSRELTEVLDLAISRAESGAPVTTGDLLLAALDSPRCVAMTFLARQSLDLPSLYARAEVASAEPDPEGPAPASQFWTEEEYAAVAAGPDAPPDAPAPDPAMGSAEPDHGSVDPGDVGGLTALAAAAPDVEAPAVPAAAPQYAAGEWVIDEHGAQVWVPAQPPARPQQAPAPPAAADPPAHWATADPESAPAPVSSEPAPAEPAEEA